MDSVQRSGVRLEDVLKSFLPELFYEWLCTDLLVWIKRRICTNGLINHEQHGGKGYRMITTSSDRRAKLSQIKITIWQFWDNQKEVVLYIAWNKALAILATRCCKLVQVQGKSGHLHGRQILWWLKKVHRKPFQLSKFPSYKWFEASKVMKLLCACLNLVLLLKHLHFPPEPLSETR